jgi:glycosyltransferase involved in cell wall biosynthesis
MRIAQIAPITERVPPKKYGGTERVISVLTEELVRRGHDVTLFATGDSETSAKLVSTYPHALRETFPEPTVKRTIWGYRHVATAYKMRHQFDIIHDHTSWLSAGVANMSRVPVVMTLHGAFTPETIALFETFDNPYLVSISESQRKPAPDLNYISTVYNGLPLSHYPFSLKNDGYLLFVGRFCEEKSPHFAIEVAKRLNLPLILAAKLEEGGSRAYFEKFIKPHLSDTIRWVGEVDEVERNRLFSKALCSLHPVAWPEPFGLTLIEAMACGTPVIAFDQGAIPEVIKHGSTGYVVNNVDEMTAAVAKIDRIDRRACRQHSLTHFGVEQMVDNYELVYDAILGASPFHHTFSQKKYQTVV